MRWDRLGLDDEYSYWMSFASEWAGGKTYYTPSVDPAPGASWSSIGNDFFDWVSGNLPQETIYDEKHPKSIAMSQSIIADQLRASISKLARWKNNVTCDDWDDNVGETATSIKTEFGAIEAFKELSNPTASFVGRGTGEITVKSVSSWYSCGNRS